MNAKLLVGLVAATALVLTAFPGLAAPAEAASVVNDDPSPAADDRPETADHGPSDDAGPPSFLSDVTPEFLADLLGGLPVPDFVASAFGATASA